MKIHLWDRGEWKPIGEVITPHAWIEANMWWGKYLIDGWIWYYEPQGWIKGSHVTTGGI